MWQYCPSKGAKYDLFCHYVPSTYHNAGMYSCCLLNEWWVNGFTRKYDYTMLVSDTEIVGGTESSTI